MRISELIQMALAAGVGMFLVSCSSGTKTVSVGALPDNVKVHKITHSMGKAEMERRITKLVNVERAKKGMSPLKSHAGLVGIAREHSAVMANQAEKKRVLLHINHDNFLKRSEAARTNYGMYALGENVAANWGYRGDKMAKVVQDWMGSPQHRRNILSKWDTGGVGVHVDSKGAIYATQLFGAGGRNVALLQ